MTVIDWFAEVASPPDTWRQAIFRVCIFVLIALPVLELCRLTELRTPAFVFGQAWGWLGAYAYFKRDRTIG